MTLELTSEQQKALYSALLTRVRTIESLLESWKKYPGPDTDFLIENYTQELVTVKELQGKVL
jgi:hypothetical protein